MWEKKFIAIIYLLFTHNSLVGTTNQTVDLLIYSMNRPLQVYALLESIERYVSGYGEIHVLYRTTSPEYYYAYNEVTKRFPKVLFTQQGQDPAGDFKPLMLKCAFQSPSAYISFIVDDTIVKDYVNLSHCVQELEAVDNSYAFFLRLGLNTIECYPLKMKTPPPCKLLHDDIYYWQFKEGGFKDGYGQLGDWNWAASNDFSVYRKKEVQPILEKLEFVNTGYEGPWWDTFRSNPVNLEKIGLCFSKSKIVNLCVNLVQWDGPFWGQFSNEWLNNKLQSHTPEILLQKFNAGFKIDISKLYLIDNHAAHIEYELNFINR